MDTIAAGATTNDPWTVIAGGAADYTWTLSAAGAADDTTGTQHSVDSNTYKIFLQLLLTMLRNIMVSEAGFCCINMLSLFILYLKLPLLDDEFKMVLVYLSTLSTARPTSSAATKIFAVSTLKGVEMPCYLV